MTTDPTVVAEPPRRRAKHRLLQSLVALSMVVGAVGTTAGTASAAQTCTGATDANLCLWIDGVGNGNFRVHVGIDVHISRADAQEYIDDAGDPFTVWIRGNDNGPNEFLFSLPMTAIGASDESGLSGDFELVVPATSLNEDSGTDEIVAVVTLTDTDTNTVTKNFVSNQLVGNWP
ncbi:hypothetical protein [Umezawaea tangerina]|uniref:Uncharacterized protein n=1 Tax=Umezawaea tangerina TaxID=84725 RepID=A0A2T0TGH2_9PSEU|nr:hypothetical protein [Umezawaea tangerina]PRY44787.1 hypothetical protein CLV43_102352 [Umezawaea tangerina]